MADSVEQRPSTPFPTEATAGPSADAVDPLAGDWAEGLRTAARPHGLAAPVRLLPGAEPARAAPARPPSAPPPARGSFDEQRTEQADLRAVLALKDSLLGEAAPAHADSVEAPEAWGSADDALGHADTVLSFASSPRASPPLASPPSALADAGQAAQPGSAEAAAPVEEAVLLLDEADEITEQGAAPEAPGAPEATAPRLAGPLETHAEPEASAAVALEGAGAFEAATPAVAAEVAAIEAGPAGSVDVDGDAFAAAASLIAQAAAEERAPAPGASPLEAQHDQGVIQLDEAAAAEAEAPPAAAAEQETQAPAEQLAPAAAEQEAPAPGGAQEDPWAHAFAAAAFAHEEPAATPPSGSAAAEEPPESEELLAEALLVPFDEASGDSPWSVPAAAVPATAAPAGAHGGWSLSSPSAHPQADLGGWATQTAPAEALPNWSAAPAAPVEDWAAAPQPAAEQQPWMPQGSSTYAQLESDATMQAWAPDASRFAPLAPGATLAGDDEPAAAEPAADEPAAAEPAAAEPAHRGPPVMSQAPAIISAPASRVPVMSPAPPAPASSRGPSLELDWDSGAQEAATHGVAPGHVPGPGDEDLPVAVEDVIFTPAPPIAQGDGPPVSLRVSGEHRVAIHTRAGRTRRGLVRDVDLSAPSFSLLPQGGGAPEQVLAGEVKAVFFMLPAGERPPSVSGPHLRVTFVDGRSIDGNREGEAADAGFFLVPSDAARTNTRRIYIPHEATSDVRED